MQKWIFSLVGCVVTACALWSPYPAHASSAPAYSLRVLGALIDPPISSPPQPGLGPVWSWANDMNASGVVVGRTHDIRGPTTHATLWVDGVPSSLGNFAELAGRPNPDANAVAINDGGTIVGNVVGTNFGSGYAVVMVAGGQATLVGEGSASAINNAGVIGGSSLLSRHATLWSDSQVIDLGAVGGTQSWVQALSNTGLAVGGSTVTGDPTFQCMPNPNSGRCFVTHAVVWDSSGAVIDLGVMAGSASRATSVNDRGHVIGTVIYAEGLPNHSFYWDGATMQDMGAAQLTDINSFDVIVGAIQAAGSYRSAAAVWLNGQAVDLNSLLDAEARQAGWYLSSAVVVNDAGQILVGAFKDNGLPAYVVLTPVDEPAPVALLCLGLVVVTWTRLRRHERLI